MSVRDQVDRTGFATTWPDMEACVAALRAVEERGEAASAGASGAPSLAAPWIAAILPHDDYLYAGRTVLPMLPGLRAHTWIVFGVCHACRRLGVRARLLFDDHDAWRVAGVEMPVDVDLRAALLTGLGKEFALVDRERQNAEHSVEALLPWLVTARPDARFVSVLVPGMSLARMREIGGRVAAVLAAQGGARSWQPGRDVGIAISADAVHYGSEGWGNGGYHPFGCGADGHAAARAQDVTIARATLAGPLSDESAARFHRLVCDEANPSYPYRITWCGVYSIPFGLAVAGRWRAVTGAPSLTGTLVRYGDSVSDGRLEVPGTSLGVTAPNTLEHWVGYASVGYR